MFELLCSNRFSARSRSRTPAQLLAIQWSGTSSRNGRHRHNTQPGPQSTTAITRPSKTHWPILPQNIATTISLTQSPLSMLSATPRTYLARRAASSPGLPTPYEEPAVPFFRSHFEAWQMIHNAGDRAGVIDNMRHVAEARAVAQNKRTLFVVIWTDVSSLPPLVDGHPDPTKAR